MSSDHREATGERFGRASKSSAPEITELEFNRAHPQNIDVASYYCQVLIHRAHTVMLAERGIITREEAIRIIRGIKEVEEDAKRNEKLVSYMATEFALINKIGEVGGKMHIARSRNDLGHTQRRLFYRDQVERLIEAVINFVKALLKKSDENLETVMPGYTHWRQAQPTTFAHYLIAHVDAAVRTVERLEDLYRRTNLCAMGACAFAGTGWDIDRHRVKELLGCDALVENSQDAVGSTDYVIEFASAVAIHMSNLSRLAEDLQIWSSDEYGMIDIDEAYAGTSSIMPQKKNPLILERIKSYAAESIGSMVATAASMKGVSYTNAQDRVNLEPEMIDLAVGSTNVMAGLTTSLTPMKDRMLENLMNGFSAMTDLADTLVRNFGISFRQAHDVIVSITLKALSEGKRADQITQEMIRESSKETLGLDLKIPEVDLHQSIDPVENVKRRKLIGGPAPESVKSMISDRWKIVGKIESRQSQRKTRIKKSITELEQAENLL